MPKISICIPAYGNPAGIERLLQSVSRQHYTDYEVILTDDSPDGLVKAVAERSGVKNLHYHKNESRLGATGNWNEAVQRAKGAYIKIMHHDDWFAEADSLERFAALLDENPQAVLGFSGSWQVTLESGERFSRCISREQEDRIAADWRELFIGNYIGAPSATIFRANRQRFEAKLKWVVDTEYYMRLLSQNPAFACSKEPLVCIGVSKDQLTEQCRKDGELNVYEYGFLFREFGLEGVKRYRRKLIDVALDFKLTYSALKPYRIPRKEYRKAALEKQWMDSVFLLGVVKRKIAERIR